MISKIVHVSVGLNVGGAELMLKRLVLHSQKKGKFQHSVISLTDLGVVGLMLQDQGITVHSLGMKSVASMPRTFFVLEPYSKIFSLVWYKLGCIMLIFWEVLQQKVCV